MSNGLLAPSTSYHSLLIIIITVTSAATNVVIIVIVNPMNMIEYLYVCFKKYVHPIKYMNA